MVPLVVNMIASDEWEVFLIADCISEFLGTFWDFFGVVCSSFSILKSVSML